MSCLFESLGRFVNVHPTQLREEICKYLLTDPTLVGELRASMIVEHQPDIKNSGDTSDVRLKSYVSEMSKSIVMGGAIEIMAFCKLYNKNVIVKNVRAMPHIKPIEFVHENATSTITLTWTGGHYDPA